MAHRSGRVCVGSGGGGRRTRRGGAALPPAMVAAGSGEGSRRGRRSCGHSGTLRPTDRPPLPAAGRRRKAHGGSEREVGPCWAAVPRGCGERGSSLLRSPRAGLAWSERDRGTGGGTSCAPASPTPHPLAGLWVEKQPRNTWVGAGRRLCQHGDVSGAASAGRPAAPGPALRPGPASRRCPAPPPPDRLPLPSSRRRPAPLRSGASRGCPSSPELLPALPGNPQRRCRAGRAQFVRCWHEVKIMSAVGGGGLPGKPGVRVLLV